MPVTREALDQLSNLQADFDEAVVAVLATQLPDWSSPWGADHDLVYWVRTSDGCIKATYWNPDAYEESSIEFPESLLFGQPTSST